MVDILILALVLGYCALIIGRRIKQIKDPSDGCNHICVGCTHACSDFSNLKDEYYAGKLNEKRS